MAEKGKGKQEDQSASVVARIDELRCKAIDLKSAGMHNILDAASAQVQAARLMQSVGIKFAENTLKEAAGLYEKGENFIGAVLLYIELDDMDAVRRISPDALNQIGVRSSFGRALDWFSRLEKGSGAKEVDAIAELKNQALKAKESTENLMKFLHKITDVQ